MTPVRLEPAALRSRVKHSTTEPLRSHNLDDDDDDDDDDEVQGAAVCYHIKPLLNKTCGHAYIVTAPAC